MSKRSELEGLIEEVEQLKERRGVLKSQQALLVVELQQIDAKLEGERGGRSNGLYEAVAQARREWLSELTDGLNERALEAQRS